MRIMILGSCGFIGSHTVDLACNRGHIVAGYDNLSSPTKYIHPDVTYYHEDIRSLTNLELAFHEFQPDAVIHLAAQPSLLFSEDMPVIDLLINAQGTLNVIQMCLKHKVEHCVFSSTSAASSGYDSENSRWIPESPYGISKRAAELYFYHYMNERSTVFRYANIYGPRQHPLGENQLIPRVIRHFLYDNDFYIVGDGNQKRQFTYVADVAKANLRAIEEGWRYGPHDICCEARSSVNDVINTVLEFIPVSNDSFIERQGEDERAFWMNPYYVQSEFDFTAQVSLREGIKETVEWWVQDEEN